MSMTEDKILAAAENCGACKRKDGMWVFTPNDLLWFVNELSTIERLAAPTPTPSAEEEAAREEQRKAEWEFMVILQENYQANKSKYAKTEWKGYTAQQAVNETYEDLIAIFKHLPLKRGDQKPIIDFLSSIDCLSAEGEAARLFPMPNEDDYTYGARDAHGEVYDMVRPEYDEDVKKCKASRLEFIKGRKSAEGEREPKETPPTGLRWVNCATLPKNPIPQYNARYWSKLLNEWIPDVIFLSTDDMKWKSCSNGLPLTNPEQYQYLSESSPLPTLEEVLQRASEYLANRKECAVDLYSMYSDQLKELIEFSRTPKQ